MITPAARDIYFSFFMFTVDLQPDDPDYTQKIAGHIKQLTEYGYAGFDLPIPPGPRYHRGELASYQGLRQRLEHASQAIGLELDRVKFTTNVGATRIFDPSSSYGDQRASALAFLKSRVDITEALGATALAGPIVLPYGVYPLSDGNQPLWSDALQDWLVPRYAAAQSIIQELGEYAEKKHIKIAIEPVDHWETAAPNLVGDVTRFLEQVPTPQVGLCIDSAHVTLGSESLATFQSNVRQLLAKRRLHYVHISAPDRGAIHDSWIPWQPFLQPILAGGYEGPFLIEVFNAIPVFLNSLRLTRRKFAIPGEDQPNPPVLSAYEIAEKGIAALQAELKKLAP